MKLKVDNEEAKRIINEYSLGATSREQPKQTSPLVAGSANHFILHDPATGKRAHCVIAEYRLDSHSWPVVYISIPSGTVNDRLAALTFLGSFVTYRGPGGFATVLPRRLFDVESLIFPHGRNYIGFDFAGKDMTMKKIQEEVPSLWRAVLHWDVCDS